MNAIRNEGGRQAILAELGQDRVLMTMETLRTAVSEMSRKPSPSIRSLNNLAGPCHRVTDGNLNTLVRHFLDERQGLGNLRRERYHADQSARRFLPATPQPQVRCSNMLQGMSSARSIHVADEWPFQMKSGHTISNGGIYLASLYQDTEQMFNLVRAAGDDCRKDRSASRSPDGANSLTDLHGCHFRVVEIYPGETVALKISPRRAVEMIGLCSPRHRRGDPRAFESELSQRSRKAVGRQKLHVAVIHSRRCFMHTLLACSAFAEKA